MLTGIRDVNYCIIGGNFTYFLFEPRIIIARSIIKYKDRN